MRAIYIPAVVAALLVGASIEFGPSALAQTVAGQSDIAKFLSDPAKLLSEYPDGGEGLVTRIRDLATSNPSALGPLVQLLTTANSAQTSAIGTGLGQAALAVVKSNPGYAENIQSVLVTATTGGTGGSNEIGSAQPKIGSTVSTKDDVKGITERGTQPLAAGTGVYLDERVHTGLSGKAEILFADRTNLTVGPVTDIKLDQFVYNPDGKGNVVVVASTGAFRFITGIQAHEDYKVETPFATMGVRGTEFIVSITPQNETIQLASGEVFGKTISNQNFSLNIPGSVLLIDNYGRTQDQPPTMQPIVNFADLGPPTTNTQFADALFSFSAATANSGIGAGNGSNGGGGGGGGEENNNSSSPGGGGTNFGSPFNVGTGTPQTDQTQTSSTPVFFSSFASSVSPAN